MRKVSLCLIESSFKDTVLGLFLVKGWFHKGTYKWPRFFQNRIGISNSRITSSTWNKPKSILGMAYWIQLYVQNVRKLSIGRRWLSYHGCFKIITETDDQSSSILPSALMLWSHSPAQLDEGKNGENSIYWCVRCLKGTLGQETITSLESLWGAGWEEMG